MKVIKLTAPFRVRSVFWVVNSAYFALRNRATDVHQAIMVLGIGQLRQWIYLMGAGNEGSSAVPRCR